MTPQPKPWKCAACFHELDEEQIQLDAEGIFHMVGPHACGPVIRNRPDPVIEAMKTVQGIFDAAIEKAKK